MTVAYDERLAPGGPKSQSTLCACMAFNTFLDYCAQDSLHTPSSSNINILMQLKVRRYIIGPKVQPTTNQSTTNLEHANPIIHEVFQPTRSPNHHLHTPSQRVHLHTDIFTDFQKFLNIYRSFHRTCTCLHWAR